MFKRPLRNCSFVLVLLMVMGSCSTYQKALKSNDVKLKRTLAVRYYKEGLETGRNSRFKRSLALLEQILPQFSGKPEGQRLAFFYADDYYRLGDYINSGYQFERFTKRYPKSDKAEEAAFKSAKSYYYLSPRYSLDQSDTYKALEKLQDYLSAYPGGSHVGEANQIIAALRHKLEKKAFEIAKLYYAQDDYKATIASMNNFIEQNPGSDYMEKVYYFRMDSEYKLAINSFRDVMEERLQKAVNYADDYLRYYPEGSHIDRAKTISEEAMAQLKEEF